MWLHLPLLCQHWLLLAMVVDIMGGETVAAMDRALHNQQEMVMVMAAAMALVIAITRKTPDMLTKMVTVCATTMLKVFAVGNVLMKTATVFAIGTKALTS